MTMFVVKQMIGSKVEMVKGMVPNMGDEDDAEKAERERLDMIKQVDDERHRKYRQVFEEREVSRQEMREKYGLKGKTKHPDWMEGAEEEPEEPEETETSEEDGGGGGDGSKNGGDEGMFEIEKKLDPYMEKAEKCVIQ